MNSLKVSVYLKSSTTLREEEGGREILAFAGSLLKWLQQRRLDESKAKGLEFHSSPTSPGDPTRVTAAGIWTRSRVAET